MHMLSNFLKIRPSKRIVMIRVGGVDFLKNVHLVLCHMSAISYQ